MGLEKEFEVALRRLRGKNADVSVEAAEIQVYLLYSLPSNCSLTTPLRPVWLMVKYVKEKVEIFHHEPNGTLD